MAGLGVPKPMSHAMDGNDRTIEATYRAAGARNRGPTHEADEIRDAINTRDAPHKSHDPNR